MSRPVSAKMIRNIPSAPKLTSKLCGSSRLSATRKWEAADIASFQAGGRWAASRRKPRHRGSRLLSLAGAVHAARADTMRLTTGQPRESAGVAAERPPGHLRPGTR
jgi:hypothetical protein